MSFKLFLETMNIRVFDPTYDAGQNTIKVKYPNGDIWIYLIYSAIEVEKIYNLGTQKPIALNAGKAAARAKSIAISAKNITNYQVR